MEEAGRIDHASWPMRAPLLAAVGAVFGLVIHALVEGRTHSVWTDQPVAMASAVFLAVSGVVLALGVERKRWVWSIGFAALAGLVAALVAWWNGAPNEWGAGEGWQLFSALIAAAVALPLFQTARDFGRWRLEAYPILSHAWTNLILWAGSWAFVLVSFLLTVMLSALFSLIGIDVLEDLMREGWFQLMLACGAFGGAVGLIRDRDNVIETVQRVVRAILSVLAPVLALGLVLFVAALPFTGLEPLWEKTRSATPILLVSMLGAVVLANAVIGNRADEEAGHPILRWSAMALAAVLLPLGLVAAVSTGKRIGQYGFTPDRLWAAVFVAIALAFAVGYLVALIRGRRGWGEVLRDTNVRLAAGVCILALFLAMPIVNFGALSVRDQVTRLERGRVTADRFDWAALRFDYGPAGRRALERLARSGPAPVRAKAMAALKADNRWALGPMVVEPRTIRRDPPKLLVTPAGASAPPRLVAAVAGTDRCGEQTCRLAMDGPARAILLSVACDRCPAEATLFEPNADGNWVPAPVPPPVRNVDASGLGLPAGPVEVRDVQRRQIFVNGKPMGDVFE